MKSKDLHFLSKYLLVVRIHLQFLPNASFMSRELVDDQQLVEVLASEAGQRVCH